MKMNDAMHPDSPAPSPIAANINLFRMIFDKLCNITVLYAGNDYYSLVSMTRQNILYAQNDAA